MGFIAFNGNYLKCEYNRSESGSINRINPSPPKRLLGVRVPHRTPFIKPNYVFFSNKTASMIQLKK